MFFIKKITTFGLPSSACLSPNGESILLSQKSKIYLRHTKDPILPSRLTLETDQLKFILGLSPDNPSAEDGKMVTVLNLQSGDLQLSIDTGMGIKGLGVTLWLLAKMRSALGA